MTVISIVFTEAVGEGVGEGLADPLGDALSEVGTVAVADDVGALASSPELHADSATTTSRALAGATVQRAARRQVLGIPAV
ncbi:hypothetical protein GCM10023145_05450 [Angustibacter luteus]